ncbi:MAG TPA: CdaR family protein, partial [Kouleothrix sp.]|nr:CdaR family protein [Kouleothrix sp.]
MSWLRSTGLRLMLSIGLAFALWVFVSYTQNPDRDTSYDSVPVDVVGRAPDLILVDKDGMPRASLPAVNVTVQADTETLKNVQQSSLRALVDLTGLSAGEHQVPVDVETTRSDLKRLTFSTKPSFLPIRLEQEITRTVPLTIELSGNVPFSFEAGKPRLTLRGQAVETVLVRGPQSRVDRVSRALVTADIDRLTANYNSPRLVQALGADGGEVAGVSIEPGSVNVLVPIGSSAGIKRVPVVPLLEGQPASGYLVRNISVEPQFVRLTGSSEPLEAVSSINTEGVDISGGSQVIRRSAQLRIPANIGLAAGEPTTVTVQIELAPIERPFQLTLPVPVSVVDVPGGLTASLSPQIIQVSLAGSAARLAAFDPSSLQGVVSARGRDAGSYTLEPAISLPEGITQAQWDQWQALP